jgi:AcrR family transcriptional regulator
VPAEETSTPASPRPLRADAHRNRDRLLEVAVRALTSDGTATNAPSTDDTGADGTGTHGAGTGAPAADITLEAIARQAGVGIGTLYRHFPTREALIEAVYRNELTRLCDAVDELLRTRAPDEALRAWMDRFVAYMTTKRGMANALRAVIASGGNPYAQSRDLLMAAIGTLLRAGAGAGTVRRDVDPGDVLLSLSGVSLAVGDRPAPGQFGRLLDLIMDGLRYRAGAV